MRAMNKIPKGRGFFYYGQIVQHTKQHTKSKQKRGRYIFCIHLTFKLPVTDVSNSSQPSLSTGPYIRIYYTIRL